MDPALKNGPFPCRDENAWRTTVKVRYAYMGTDNAEITVEDLLPDLALLAQAFDLSSSQPVPQGSIGWDSQQERTYRQKLKDLALEAKNFARGSSQARKQINDLGKQANRYLRQIDDFYTKDTRRVGRPLSSPYPKGGEFDSPSTRVKRDELRHDIIEAYRNAAQLLWCADFGMAEIDAYLQNREDYEAPIKPSPGGLIDPAWTNYTPIEYDAADWNISEADFGEVNGVVTDYEPETETEEPAQAEGSGAAVAVAAIAGLGLIYLLTRK